MVSASVIAPVADLLKKEPYDKLFDRYYGVSQLLSDEDSQHRFASDLRAILGLG